MTRLGHDALVTGESRGKLYRTKLVKTETGYVAQTQLLACLSMLTVDCCLAPDGLRVACHSGGPDWGSGPTVEALSHQVFRPSHPQPAVVWSNGPREVRVEFDRPVDPALLKDSLKHIRLTAGKYVRAGDRFESIWPGYAIVQAQKVAPRYDVPVRSVQLTPDRRTLVLATDPHAAAIGYGLTLPPMGRPPHDQHAAGDLPQYPDIDVDFDLTGCEATWVPADGSAAWTGWLPHPDLQVSRAFTAGSATHDELWASMQKPGEFRLRTRIDLNHMLQPAVQPGSRLDFEYPPETVMLETFTTGVGEELFDFERHPDDVANLSKHYISARNGGWVNTSKFGPATPKVVNLDLHLRHSGGELPLTFSFTTDADSRPRPLPIRRFFLPWSEMATTIATESVAIHYPELDGGSWARGRTVFFSEEAACSKCHSVHARGGNLAPDLSNLIHRDYTSVLRDIEKPSFAINPDHLAYVIALKDGRVLTGVMHSVNGRLQIGDTKGNITEIAQGDIDQITASSVSVMPEGLPKLLGQEKLRDLLAFLLLHAGDARLRHR
ncbi:MAG: hypothetical protein U0992_11225 [Planctomycetaceae bacterium]